MISQMKVCAQETILKDSALSEFRKEHYNTAIQLLEKALVQDSSDSELYYYLGWFNHYLAYDSRPLHGYDFSHSKKIFTYLDKALELNPDYGNAKYFYGAECSGIALNAMQRSDAGKVKQFYQKAYNKDAYPLWLIEFGKNLLQSCDQNAILLTGGNADYDVCTYLQLHQSMRKDISIIPIGNIDRPWYVNMLKLGLEDVFRPVELSLTEEQIYDIHPFKWDTTLIAIPVSPSMRIQYELPKDYTLDWQVNPDLSSLRQHSKIGGEKAQSRKYLSPQKAVLLQIIEDNFQKRPILFSNLCDPWFYEGLEEYLSNYGLVSRLNPVNTEEYDFRHDYKKIESLLKAENLADYYDVVTHNIPRISNITSTYHKTAYLLARHYAESGQQEKLGQLIEVYRNYLIVGMDKSTEETIIRVMEKMREKR